MKTSQADIFKWVLLGAGIIAVYKLMNKFGLIKTAEQQAQEQEQSGATTGGQLPPPTSGSGKPNATDLRNAEASLFINVFNPSILDRPPFTRFNQKRYKRDNAIYSAKLLRDAHNWFTDNEEEVYSVFRNIGYQSQVSDIAKAYYDLYREDLATKLSPASGGFMNESEFQLVINIIKTKPSGLSIP